MISFVIKKKSKGDLFDMFQYTRLCKQQSINNKGAGTSMLTSDVIAENH